MWCGVACDVFGILTILTIVTILTTPTILNRNVPDIFNRKRHQRAGARKVACAKKCVRVSAHRYVMLATSER